jgi:methionine biosynthesis protein MetW
MSKEVDRYKLRIVYDTIRNKKGKILDLGCGEGFLGSLCKNTHRWTGIEFDSGSVKRAKKKGLQVKQYDLNKGKIPFKSEQFDIVVASDVLEHIIYSQKILQEIKRVLKDGGLAIISLPNDFHIKSRLRFLFNKPVYTNPFGKEAHLHLFTMNQGRALIRKYFKIKREIYYPGFSPRFLSIKTRHSLVNLSPSLFSRGVIFFCRK